MYIGEQLSDLSERKLTWAAQLGVEHVAVASPTVMDIEQEDGTWDVAALRQTKAHLASFGMAFDVLALNLQSTYMTQQRFPGIMRGLPSRDAEIEVIKQNIRSASEAGIPALKYNLSLLAVPRTRRTPGRGGVTYSHFDIAEWTDHSLTEAGPVSAEDMWDRITYFLERVIPVAEEYGVQMACHPHDPAVPHDVGLRGVHRVLGSTAGLKRFLNIAPSAYHGLNFCQGTVAEMCEDPASEVPEAIRQFGAARKIFMVHFRNIRGGFLNFEEVYPDNGDVDMHQAVQEYREIGYEGMLCPDHVPRSEVDPDGERQHSFCLGYTRALIQAVSAHS
ncbi:MAG: mannonate dehydratase [Dehalococcoidia bacterium]|nr:mannonate dehydratase [Dehalococcoidia bacterium]